MAASRVLLLIFAACLFVSAGRFPAAGPPAAGRSVRCTHDCKCGCKTSGECDCKKFAPRE